MLDQSLTSYLMASIVSRDIGTAWNQLSRRPKTTITCAGGFILQARDNADACVHAPSHVLNFTLLLVGTEHAPTRT